LGGPQETDLIMLRDKRWLRLIVSVYVDDTPNGPYLKVASSSYQYQARGDPDSWVFRYDYLRKSPTREPGAHLQIRGSLQEEGILPPDEPLSVVQFPTRRVSLEAVIRLLAMEFHVPCKEGPEWMNGALQEAEKAFLEIAHEAEPALFEPSN
jgi:hypothetical protein